jgi:transposase InsO family protein
MAIFEYINGFHNPRRQAEMAIFEYINGFHNPRRRHSALGWTSPVAFERKVA